MILWELLGTQIAKRWYKERLGNIEGMTAMTM
jgi:hypothetical protein